MDDLLVDFLAETNENIGVLDSEIVKWEQNPEDKELLGSIFRVMHTIKGTCGFVGLPRLEKLAHAAENVMGKARDGELVVNSRIISVILLSLDRIKELLVAIEDTQKEPEGEDSDLIDVLHAIEHGTDTGPKKSVAAPVVETPVAEAPVVDTPVVEQKAEAAAKLDVEDHADAGAKQEGVKEGKDKSIASQTVRIKVDLLEDLMATVSELVLARNQLLQLARSTREERFVAPLQQLNAITSSLQENVMKTRMQPVGNAWTKLPRIIRDLSIELGKKIDLQMLGNETELDRQVAEIIQDPLTHMVRNSADHGIEGPEERKAAKKPEVGRVTLNAYHEGGYIIIELSDDGRGLNVARIKEKALSSKIVTEEQLANMSENEVLMLIFRPGFSTAKEVTAVSGRGVGMDVVRTNIEKIGGTVELASVMGKGTSVKIKIPLTLAIVAVLIVEVSGQKFAIPQINVIELAQMSAGSDQRIEYINDTPVLRLRNKLLPLVSLRKLMRLDEDKVQNNDAKKKDQFVIVTQVGPNTFGVLVDRVYDTEEIVVKPLAPILRDITVFSGNTILGDGSVIMILDPLGLLGNIVSAAGQETALEQREAEALKRDHSSLLLFKSGNLIMGVPLIHVARIEDIDMRTVEQKETGRPVIQYRDKLMPLIMVTEGDELPVEGNKTVLVFTENNLNVGLVTDGIVDIADGSMDLESAHARPGVLGSAIIAGRATNIIDTNHYMARLHGKVKAAKKGETAEPIVLRKGSGRLLMVDDSNFFSEMLRPLLLSAGYDVQTARGALEALTLREAGETFDVIITDIEMPDMDGFAFTQKIREDGLWQCTPVIGLSSHSSQKHTKKGREVGFHDYITKFDNTALLETLANLTSEKV